MQDTSQNSIMQSPNTEADIGYLLKITKVKIRQNGIEYYFNPLGKTVIVSALENIKTKDLTFSMTYIRAHQKSILLPTNMIAPQVYANQLKKEEMKLKDIYNEGEEFAQVIQILN